jgi:A/G-specific adenine glycosylase
MNFFSKLYNWYEEHHRNLPWRNTNDPYHIWLSEIILQQTRVNQGIDYYYRFIEKYPTIESLANADESDVLKTWQGLGYYSRARNLHFAAQQIVEIHHGKFPNKYQDILNLKGIGEYTAAAIGSFAFNLPHPVVDGNVSRFISRFAGIKEPINETRGLKKIKLVIDEVFNPSRAADFNQAIMEFGALQCKPKNPSCNNCVFNTTCFAYENNCVNELPYKKSKTKIKHRYFNYIIIKDNKHQTFIEKRTGNDIWKQLYQFPLIESENRIDIETLIQHPELKKWLGKTRPVIHHFSEGTKHVLTHRIIHASFIEINANIKNIPKHWISVPVEKIEKFAVPVLIENYLKKSDWF